MKKVKLSRCIQVPKFGVFNKSQKIGFDDQYANHVVKNMKAGEYIDDSEVVELEITVTKTETPEKIPLENNPKTN